MSSERTALVTGATGYVGGRLVPRLLDRGWRVRCLVRDTRKLAARDWHEHPGVEVVTGDALDQQAVAEAMKGCEVAYYLIHSMIASGEAYREKDRRLAHTFARAAAEAGVPRIIYLGGLGETGEGLSEHLASRREVEQALASETARVTVLRAAMIIGSGSASFEILRYLVERLPIMITPKWVSTPSQPISIHDTLHYLVASAETPSTEGLTLDIGGPEVMTYREIMDVMAEELGLRKRIIIPVPVLTPALSSRWIHLITPVESAIARPLAEGLKNPVVCRDDRAFELMPGPRLTVREAIRAASESAGAELESSWTDAGVVPGDPEWAGGRVYEDVRTVEVQAPPEAAFAAACRVGGRYGWFNADWLWRLRGVMDRAIGGPGLARGRRRPDRILYGDVLDFWRVADIVPGQRLLLHAQMRLPGEAILEFSVEPQPSGSRLTQTARFRPRGLAGVLYWMAVTPLHGIVFQSMLQGIRHRAESSESPELASA